nr:hypothetical protein JVH1_8723 [Rhodococcus sp. JVH1]
MSLHAQLSAPNTDLLACLIFSAKGVGRAAQPYVLSHEVRSTSSVPMSVPEPSMQP